MHFKLKIAILAIAVAVAACGKSGLNSASSVGEQVICLMSPDGIEKVENSNTVFRSDVFMLAQD